MTAESYQLSGAVPADASTRECDRQAERERRARFGRTAVVRTAANVTSAFWPEQHSPTADSAPIHCPCGGKAEAVTALTGVGIQNGDESLDLSYPLVLMTEAIRGVSPRATNRAADHLSASSGRVQVVSPQFHSCLLARASSRAGGVKTRPILRPDRAQPGRARASRSRPLLAYAQAILGRAVDRPPNLGVRALARQAHKQAAIWGVLPARRSPTPDPRASP